MKIQSEFLILPLFLQVFDICVFLRVSSAEETLEIHREPLWPLGKRIFMPDCKNPQVSISGLLEHNPIRIGDPTSEVTYYFYPKTSSGEPVKVDLRNLGEMRKHVEPEGLWIFGFHGFNGDYTAGPIFRSTAKDIHATRVSNIVQVDFKRLAAAPFYLTAKDNMKIVGAHVASMISQLVSMSLARAERIHLVGFSLGAHAAGYAGKTLGEKYKLKQHRITALDPAGPAFDLETKGNRLDPSDARLVEVYHTCGGLLGTVKPTGHVDFYVNGGKPIQPKCPLLESLTLYSCSHQYALKVFNHTIEGSYVAQKCKDSKSAIKGSCSTGFPCSVGFLLPNCPPGIYYLGTR